MLLCRTSPCTGHGLENTPLYPLLALSDRISTPPWQRKTARDGIAPSERLLSMRKILEVGHQTES